MYRQRYSKSFYISLFKLDNGFGTWRKVLWRPKSKVSVLLGPGTDGGMDGKREGGWCMVKMCWDRGGRIFFWDGVCFGAVDRARVSAAMGGRGWPEFLEYTKIHNCTGGHKTAEFALTRWVLSAHRGLASDPPKTHNTHLRQHTPCDTLQLHLRRSRRNLSPWGTACLTFRHVQICGLTDCPATCSDTMYFAIRCQMSTRGWP